MSQESRGASLRLRVLLPGTEGQATEVLGGETQGDTALHLLGIGKECQRTKHPVRRDHEQRVMVAMHHCERFMGGGSARPVLFCWLAATRRARVKSS